MLVLVVQALDQRRTRPQDVAVMSRSRQGVGTPPEGTGPPKTAVPKVLPLYISLDPKGVDVTGAPRLPSSAPILPHPTPPTKKIRNSWK